MSSGLNHSCSRDVGLLGAIRKKLLRRSPSRATPATPHLWDKNSKLPRLVKNIPTPLIIVSVALVVWTFILPLLAHLITMGRARWLAHERAAARANHTKT